MIKDLGYTEHWENELMLACLELEEAESITLAKLVLESYSFKEQLKISKMGKLFSDETLREQAETHLSTLERVQDSIKAITSKDFSRALDGYISLMNDELESIF